MRNNADRKPQMRTEGFIPLRDEQGEKGIGLPTLKVNNKFNLVKSFRLRLPRNNLSLTGFTPLEKASDEVGGGIPYKGEKGIGLPTLKVNNKFNLIKSCRLRLPKGSLSLTGFTPFRDAKEENKLISAGLKNKKKLFPLKSCRLRLPRNNLSLTGFTLIEVLCVIVIISVFFSLSIPMLSKTAGNFHLRSKASQLKSMCEFLKRTSISENKTYKLVIDFAQNSYSVLQSSHKNPDEFLTAKDSLLRTRTLPKSMSFFSPANTTEKQEIVFKQTGAVSSAEFFITNNKDTTAKLSTTLSGEILLEYI